MQSDHADALAALNHALFGEPSSEFPSGQFPTGLVQKIGYLQMVVQMLAKESEQQEQIGSLVDQVLVAARSLFLDQQRNAGNSASVVQQMGSAVNPKQEEESVFPDSGLETYELIELDAMEILAEHTHFCEVCGKGFKRDANLRMHMRGHGDEYKTPAALARPKNSDGRVSWQKRYSCPYVGCKRNRHHKKFVPLKTVLCVKNHYRRSHCPKLLQCTRCRVKRFAVLADLKTHEKHCGREKWQCSCGTTFSRKDKLLGHIGLFVGHKPLMTQPVTVSASSSSNSYSDLLEELNMGIVGSSFEVDGILGDSLGINGKNGEQTFWGSQGLADMLAGNSDNMFVGDRGDNVLHDHGGGGFSFLN